MRYLCVECNRSLPPGTAVCPLDGAPVTSKPDDDESLIGTRLDGRFQVDSIVGRGGMGTVFRGTQVSVGRPVAIKTLRPDLVRSDDAVRRFYREAKLVSRLNHPNVVSVVDFGATGDGLLYLVMELVHGRSLYRELLRGRLPMRRAVRIASQVCDALAEAHAIGIIHRDLKPDNILLTDHAARRDFVKVVDFGVATVVENGRRADTRITNIGGVVGTPAYMCPEQVAGAETLTPAADLYALALILFEMLTGRPPFAGDGAAHVMVAHATQPPPTLQSVAPDLQLPPQLEAFVSRGLAKQPLDRFEDAPAFRRALEDAAAGRDHDPNRRSASDAYPPQRLPSAELVASSGNPVTSLAAALTEDDVRASAADLPEVGSEPDKSGTNAGLAGLGGPSTAVIGPAAEARSRSVAATELYRSEPVGGRPGAQTVARAAAPTAVLATARSPENSALAADPPAARVLWPWLAGAALVVAAAVAWGATKWRDPTPRLAPSTAAPAAAVPALPLTPQPQRLLPVAKPAPTPAEPPVVPAPAPDTPTVQPPAAESPPPAAKPDKTARKRPKANPFGLQ